MFRGFLGGSLVGAVVAVVGLGTASLLGPQPAGNTPPAAPQVAAPEAAPANATAQSEATSAAPIEPATAPATVETPVAEPTAESAPPVADTEPPAAPVAVAVEGAPTAPVAGQGAEAPALNPDSPVLPNPQAPAPAVPDSEDSLAVSTTPAPAPSEAAAGDEVVELQTPVEGARAAPALPEEEPVPGGMVAPDATGEIAVLVVPDAPAVPESVPEPAPEPAMPEALPEVSVEEPTAPIEPTPDIVAELAPAPETGPAPVVGLSGEPARTMPTSDDTVRVIRPSTDEATAAEPAEPELFGAALTGVALQDFGTPFEDDGRPILSIVLVDDGTMPGGPAALSAAGVPVTVAVDPAAERAAALVRAYRDAGVEVALRINLPESFEAQDVATTLEALFSDNPETVALVDMDGNGLPRARGGTEEVMARLADDGRGFVSLSRGLNTAQRAAEAAEVPAAIFYRDLDAEGQDARVIRRFLDQAAFRARQESGVVLLGRVRPETISALILWSTANRAGQVNQAPLSAVLLGDM